MVGLAGIAKKCTLQTPGKSSLRKETPETRANEASERPRRAFATPNESSLRAKKARGE